MSDERDVPGYGGRLWRGFTGSLAVGLVALLLLVLGAQAIGWGTDSEGPGLPHVVGHLTGAVAALALQRIADRRRGTPAGLAGLGVVAVALAVLWLFWWGS